MDRMSSDLIGLYKQLGDMEQTKEIKQLKNQIKEELHQRQVANLAELTNIGRVIGYESLEEEFKKASELIEQMKNR